MSHKERIISILLILGSVSAGLCQDPKQKQGVLFDALKKGDLKKVVALLDSGADVNIRGELNYTPLIMAAKFNQIEIAEVLCDRGADINAVASSSAIDGEIGFTALLWATQNCNLNLAELLIKKGADVECPGAEGDTPLMVAARRNCLPLIGRFIEKGAPINTVREFDRATALVEAVEQGHLDVANYLIEHGASLETVNSSGMSLLAIAAKVGCLAEVRYFFDKGLAVNKRDNNGNTAVYHAIGLGIERTYILQYLLEHGGDPNLRSTIRISPLMQASLEGLASQARLLISKGALVNDADFQKETPLHYACRGIPDEPQLHLWGDDSATTIQLLVDRGASVNAQDFEGKTPLMNAARCNVLEITEILVSHGALVNIKDNNGWTALMYAADWNRTDAIKVLLAKGADLNFRNSKGETALAVANKKKSSAQAYELLKSLGAKD
jgi:ankyrin repeat protein